ncbi:MAG TPA: purine-nucleoside phosphorylase [Thermotogota bacterium]|nr:purine-nucleoside phosphorylase [Thermotogota bacterium]HRW33968.1 purine-nucleoside phosphorylase [Thermotogota bacterium]
MNQKDYKKSVEEVAAFLKDKLNDIPKIGIILGSGLSGIAEELENKKVFNYSDIPGFPLSTAPGHKGELIFGKLGKNEIILMNGRFHYYEGYEMNQVVFPIRVMQMMGVEYLFITNAAGGLNPDFEIGVPMLIKDHINMMGDNPLIGQNIEEWGPRFPDMSDTYQTELRKLILETAREIGESLYEGIYVAVSGPNFETPAELKMFRHMGGDAIGMSSVPEAICAAHGGIKVVGLSAITDKAVGEDLQPLTAQEVIEVARKTGNKISTLIKAVCEKI